MGLPVHLPDSARVTGNRKLGFVGKRLNFGVADDTPKTFLDFQQLVCGPRGVAPREALLSSQLPQVSRLNSFLPLRLHRNICRRANVSLEQSRGGNMHAGPFAHTSVRKRTPLYRRIRSSAVLAPGFIGFIERWTWQPRCSCLVPGLRALAVDPITALRCE